MNHLKYTIQTSLVVQWLRIHCQCRGEGFNSWSGKIPHAIEQLSPCTANTEPACFTACALQREATAMRNPRTKSREQPPLAETSKSLSAARKTQSSQNKAHTSVAFSVFIVLCNHHLYIVPGPFHHPQKETLYPLSSHSLLPPPCSPWQPIICLYGYAFSGYFI